MRTTQRRDGDDWTITTSVGRTALLVALGRALETRRQDALIDDPFAEEFVRAAGDDDLTPEKTLADAEDDPAVARALLLSGDMMAARTRWIDDEIARATAAGCRQVVLLASGLDARGVRLPWTADTTVFEIDRSSVLEFKDEVLRTLDARSAARRISVACDLRDDWLAALRAAGLVDDAPTFWLAEGLLPYLLPADQQRLLETITAIAAPGSVLQFDTAAVDRDRDLASFDEDVERFGVSIEELFLDTGDLDPQAWLDDHGWVTRARGADTVLADHGRHAPDDDRRDTMLAGLRLVTAHRP